MRADEFDERLAAAWRGARSSGVISESIERIREHAAGYVPAAWRVRPPARLVDIGSGAGVPGVHLAELLVDARVWLVDANERRCDMARAAVSAVGLQDRVSVLHTRAEDLARDDEWRGSFDGLVARLFGRPSEVAECGLALLAEGGRLVVSVNEESRRWWKIAPLAELGTRFEAEWTNPSGSYVSVVRWREGPAGFPRREAARSRRPWPVS